MIVVPSLHGLLFPPVAGERIWWGGEFTAIGGQPRTRCALLRAGVADLAFTCTADDSVFAIAYDAVNDKLWVGGRFSTINGSAGTALVCVNADTGAVIHSYAFTNPSAPPGLVSRLAIDAAGGFIYAAGTFTTIDGNACHHAARFSLTTGAYDTTWVPNASNSCSCVAVDGTYVYLGGTFVTMNGTARNAVARVDKVLGTTADAAWNPAPVTAGFALGDILPHAVGSIFICGNFQTVNGGGTTRNGLFEVDGTNGTVTAWDPGNKILGGALAQQPGGICLLERDALSFFAGGYFTSSAALAGPGRQAAFTYAGALDAAFAESPSLGNSTRVRCMKMAGSLVLVAATGVNAEAYAYDAATGALSTSFGANNNVWAVERAA